MNPQGEDQRTKAKLSLLERLKGLKMRSEEPPVQPQEAKNYREPIPSKIDMPEIGQKRSLFNNGKPEVYLYPQVHAEDSQNPKMQEEPQNNQLKQIEIEDSDGEKQKEQKKEINIKDRHEMSKAEREAKAREQVKRINRVKKPYYEHYSKEGVYQPCLPHVQEHENPSGKPPDIPEELLKGIQVIPKRPWVFFGPQNIPPTDCEQINANNFTKIFEETKKQKRHNSGILKKSNLKRRGQKINDQFSEISDDFTSNFNISDSVDLSRDSDLISEFRSQSKKDSVKMDDDDDQDSGELSMSGTVTQKQKYNLFDSDEESEEGVSEKKGIKPRESTDKQSVFSDSFSMNKKEQSESDSDESEQIETPLKKRRNHQESSSKINEDSISQSVPVQKKGRNKSNKNMGESESEVSNPKRKRSSRKPKRVTRSRLMKEEESQISESEHQKQEGSPGSPASQQLNQRKKSLRRRKK